jgi:hypothetical protein
VLQLLRAWSRKVHVPLSECQFLAIQDYKYGCQPHGSAAHVCHDVAHVSMATRDAALDNLKCIVDPAVGIKNCEALELTWGSYRDNWPSPTTFVLKCKARSTVQCTIPLSFPNGRKEWPARVQPFGLAPPCHLTKSDLESCRRTIRQTASHRPRDGGSDRVGQFQARNPEVCGKNRDGM